jgi:hypothetical protein
MDDREVLQRLIELSRAEQALVDNVNDFYVVVRNVVTTFGPQYLTLTPLKWADGLTGATATLRIGKRASVEFQWHPQRSDENGRRSLGRFSALGPASVDTRWDLVVTERGQAAWNANPKWQDEVQQGVLEIIDVVARTLTREIAF